MNRRLVIICIVAVCILAAVSTVLAAASPDAFFQAGQFLKDALGNKENGLQNTNVLAKYDGTPITADIVQHHKNMNILRSAEIASEMDTDYEIIHKIIESMILLEEANRRGLSATESEIEAMVNGAIEAYSLPSGKEIIDPFLEGAGITFEEYLTMLREQAPRVIARQKLIDAVGKEYCEKNNLEFTKMNPPAALVAAQDAFIAELFEQNKHKIEYYIDIPSLS